MVVRWEDALVERQVRVGLFSQFVTVVRGQAFLAVRFSRLTRLTRLTRLSTSTSVDLPLNTSATAALADRSCLLFYFLYKHVRVRTHINIISSLYRGLYRSVI